MNGTDQIEISFFLGAHRIGMQYLNQCLQNNQELLAQDDIVAPSFKDCSVALSQLIMNTNKGQSYSEARSAFLQKLLGENQSAKRLVIMVNNLAGTVRNPIAKGQAYTPLSAKIEALTTVFKDDQLRFFYGIRHPAQFVISAYSALVKAGQADTFQKYIERMDIESFRWSATFERILAAQPDLNLLVWKYEDLADVQHQLIGEMTGVSDPEALSFPTRATNKGLSLEGSELLREYLLDAPDIDADDMRKIMREYAENYPSFEMPRHHGIMSNERILQLTYGYDDDWYYIRRMEGLNTIAKPDNAAG